MWNKCAGQAIRLVCRLKMKGVSHTPLFVYELLDLLIGWESILVMIERGEKSD